MAAELSPAQFSVASTVLSALCVARRALQGLDDFETALAVLSELAKRANAASTRSKIDRRQTRLVRWLATMRGSFPSLRDATGGPGLGAALASIRFLDDFDLKSLSLLADETPRDLADLATVAVAQLSKAATACKANAAAAPGALPARVSCVELEPAHDTACDGSPTVWLFPRGIAVAATVSTVSRKCLKLEAAVIARDSDRVHSITCRLDTCTGEGLAITVLLLDEQPGAAGGAGAASSSTAAAEPTGAADASVGGGTLIARSGAVQCQREVAHCGHGGACIEISHVRIFAECTGDC